MPALNDGHGALRSQGPGNIPTRDAAQSLDSSNPEVIVKLELNVVDASAVNRLVAPSDFAMPSGVRMDDTAGGQCHRHCMCSVSNGRHTARDEDVVVHVAEAAASGPVTYSAIARQFIWLG